ncbi:hypothetical protein AB6A40_003274 [Gnathostoma spinigerum]|uniref:Uncharacterized protein n=1 Tax=Gnathostoma spinigerum TaxID=75299 RepID=A0ABD6E927_9BILA
MNAINIRQLIAIIATILLQTRADIASVGRNFEVVFPINNAETASETSISLEFIRYEFSYLNIRVNYPIFTLNGSELTRTTEEKSTYVWYSRTATLTFEGTSIYRNLTVGLQSYPDMRFIITSDDLMQVIAHNYATDGSGDSFTGQS